jgi:large repetitive protein
VEPATSRFPAPADRTYTTTYDAAGHVASQILPGNVTQTFDYDDDGNLTSQTGSGAEAATTARTFGYDLADRMTSMSGSGGANSITYDDRGLPLSISGPSGNSSFGYDGSGDITSRTDAAGTRNYTYDLDGRVSTIANTTAGVNVGYHYNSVSAIDQITYGGTGDTRQMTYDKFDRLTGDELKTSGGASVAKISYGRDNNGNETSKTTTNFNGVTTANTYQYDLADRLTDWNSGTTDTAYAYDKSGSRTQNGTQHFTYDEQNRLLTDATSSYTYTPRGTLATTTTGSSVWHTQADAFGQIVSQESAAGTETYDYDALVPR